MDPFQSTSERYRGKLIAEDEPLTWISYQSQAGLTPQGKTF